MDYKITPRRLTIAFLLFVALIVIGLMTFNRPYVEFKSNSEDALATMVKFQGEIPYKDALNYSVAKDPGFVFIDVRNPYEYAQGHINGALNISLMELLSKENLKSLKAFESEGKAIILYGNDQSSVNGAQQVLLQVGLKKVLVMQGGYLYLSDSSLDILADSIHRDIPEKAWYDYAELLNEKPIMKVEASNETAQKKQVIVKEKPKARPTPPPSPIQSEPEGC